MIIDNNILNHLINNTINIVSIMNHLINKMVYIIGIAKSENERNLVINVAKGVYGVEEVIDYISIKTDEI